MRILLLTFLLFPIFSIAQSHEDEIETFRNHYVAEHLEEDHSPIKYNNAKDLDFFKANKKFKVIAQVALLKDKKGFTMLTHTGNKKQYYKYAKLTFEIGPIEQVLFLYQSKRLMQEEEYKDYLFLPFTDATNYITTFGGGRYIDFVLSEIQDGKLILDFNKCYNPYCAYAGGYNCPIPPEENRLDIAIQAGEKLFKGQVEPH